jgi:hypothetical protein
VSRILRAVALLASVLADEGEVLDTADNYLHWLTGPHRAVSINPTADPPVDKPGGTDGNGNSMPLQIELPDTQDVVVHANPKDAEGFAASGDTITWAVTDAVGGPTDVVLTPSVDTLSCYVASGAPAAGILLTLSDPAGNSEVVTIDVLGGPVKSLGASADAPVDKPVPAP